jgi:hypothetical protein
MFTSSTPVKTIQIFNIKLMMDLSDASNGLMMMLDLFLEAGMVLYIHGTFIKTKMMLET